MLKLRTLDLSDVGVFPGERSFDLTGRMLGVVGSNGRGKSTILSLIHWCMTDDNSRAGKSDTVALRRLSPDQPYARLVFEIDGEPASITRWVPDGNRTGRRRLVRGDGSWSTQDEVRSKIAEWTGSPPKILSEFVFVEQGRLAAVVEDRPSERAKALQRLFGVDEAEKARSKVIDHLGALPAPPDPDMMAMLRTRYVESETEWIRADLALRGIDPPIAGVDEARDLIGRFASESAVRAELSGLEAGLAMCRDRLARPVVSAPDQDDLAVLTRMQSEWRAYRADFSKCAELRRELDLVLGRMEDVPTPGSPPEPSEELVSLRMRKYAITVLIECPESGSSCPVCDGQLSPAMSDRLSAKADLDRLEKLESEFSLLAVNHAKLVDKAKTVKAKNDELARRYSEIRERIEAFPELVAPEVSEADVELLIREYNRKAAAAEADFNDRVRASQQADRISSQLEAKRKSLPSDPVTVEQESAARVVVEAHLRLEEARRAAKVKADTLRSAFDSARQLLEKAEALDADSARVEIHRKRVIAVRDLLHRDAAPSRSVKGCLDGLSDDLNTTLGTLKARFRVSVRDDGELMAEFRDGTSTSVIRANRISKGERAVLGLAWTIAAASRYAPGVGVLCLDEPTDGLDRERVGALRSALSAWSESDRTSQCIVVTHERSLMGVFDRVIDLG